MSSLATQGPETEQSGVLLTESKPLRLRLLPLTIAVVCATTMIPLRVRWPSPVFLDLLLNREDIFNNILLYMPLGWALGTRSLRKCLLIAFGLSLLAETLQF